MADTVQVSVASLKAGRDSGDWSKDLIRLSMKTAEGIAVEFDLSVMAVSLLMITAEPALAAIETRARAQGEDLP